MYDILALSNQNDNIFCYFTILRWLRLGIPPPSNNRTYLILQIIRYPPYLLFLLL